MSNNTPSSLICFKNGYSYVNIPVILTPEKLSDDGIKECQVGPLPSFAVHGTVALAAHDPGTVKIFSISQAAKETIKPRPLKIPEFEKESDRDFSYERILEENIGAAVEIKCAEKEGKIVVERESYMGIVKAIYKDGRGQSMVALRSMDKRIGDQLIRCSTVVFIQSIESRQSLDNGKKCPYCISL